MKFPRLFKSRYPDSTFQGKDWIHNIDPEDVQAFARIGLEASDYGRSGGKALVKKYGRKYMKEIGRRGAQVTNQIHAFNRMMEDEEVYGRGLL